MGRCPSARVGRIDETGWSVTQTLPWPGRFWACVRAADRQGDVFGAEGRAIRWELEPRGAFARLLFAREAVAIALVAEADAEDLLVLPAPVTPR